MDNTKEIDGKTYTVYPLGAKKGSKLLAALNKVVGAAAGGGVKGIFEALDDAMVTRLIDELAPTTTVDLGEGKSPRLDSIFDLHFRSNYGAMLEWLLFALEVNFETFYAALPRILASRATQTQPATEKTES